MVARFFFPPNWPIIVILYIFSDFFPPYILNNLINVLYLFVYFILIGFERYNIMRQDPRLCFLSRCGPPDGAALLAELQNS